MPNVIGVNWNLIYRKQVEKLNKTIDRLKRENNVMRIRLAKHEKNSRMVKWYNDRDINENNNIGTTGNRQDDNVVGSSGSVHTKGD